MCLAMVLDFHFHLQRLHYGKFTGALYIRSLANHKYHSFFFCHLLKWHKTSSTAQVPCCMLYPRHEYPSWLGKRYIGSFSLGSDWGRQNFWACVPEEKQCWGALKVSRDSLHTVLLHLQQFPQQPSHGCLDWLWIPGNSVSCSTWI